MTTLGDQFVKGPYTIEEILKVPAWWAQHRSEISAFHISRDCSHNAQRVSPPTGNIGDAIRANTVPCFRCIDGVDRGPGAYARLRWPVVRDAALGLVSC